MNTIRKNTLKVLVLVALFSTTVFAEGEMGGGGLADNGQGTKIVITTTTTEGDGEMGGGGLTDLLTSIYQYLDRMF